MIACHVFIAFHTDPSCLTVPQTLPSASPPPLSSNPHLFNELHTSLHLAHFKRFITSLVSTTSESFVFSKKITLILSTTSALLRENTGGGGTPIFQSQPQTQPNSYFCTLKLLYSSPRNRRCPNPLSPPPHTTQPPTSPPAPNPTPWAKWTFP